ncbi:MAG TPA: sugar-binding protein, partial [bacterium]|nr:sugar-binding protein [bacterium]
TGCGTVDLTASATYKTVWNANGLWIGVTVSDPGTLYADTAAPWNGSGVEIFFDLNDARGGYNTTSGDYNDANTYQWAITYNAAAQAQYHNATARTVLAASKATAGAGYTMEVEIPWANLGVSAPSAGALSGLDVAVDVANAAGTARDHQIVAYNGSFNAYDQAPAEWGGVQVDACNSDTATNTPVVTATPSRTNTAVVTATPSRTNSPVVAATATPTPTAACPAAAPNFGPNVLIFDPGMSSASIQSQIDTVYGAQSGNQFGNARYALLFKPGTYNNSVNVGYYTQALGLGASPDDVLINGGVTSNAALPNGNATCNFWQGAENMAVVPSGGTDKWAVSQACPMRRMHIKGGLILSDTGSTNWSSGGFLGDTLIDGNINSGTQQQWLSRGCQWGSWSGSNWNMVFVGDLNAPSGAAWPNPPDTVINQAPLTREKPFLQIDSCGNYSVFVPALAANSAGTTWAGGSEAGSALPLSQFYIAQASVDTAATLNAALAAGKNLLFTPGIYSLTATLNVNNPNTVILGLGLATLLAQNGVTAMAVADVDGVKIAGLLFDAGATASPLLLQMGPGGSAADHGANPSSLSDIFFRVGGAAVGKVAACLQINSNNVIGDDFWVWRADHGSGVGWTSNTATNGVIVNGNNVTIYGLLVEHFQQYQTLWNGNGGSVYFYQSEAPYDPPNQAAWMAGTEDGYSSYKVADTVTSHQAYGVGIYCYFDVNSSVMLGNAIEVPASGLDGAMFHNMTTVSLGGVGQITNIINGYGAAANAANNVSRLPF